MGAADTTAIVYDATALLPRSEFPGAEHTYPLPFRMVENGRVFEHPREVPQSAFPESLYRAAGVRWVPPSPAVVRKQLQRLARRYRNIVVLTGSATLSPAYHHALEAAAGLFHSLHLQVFDSQSFGLGLGWRVEYAAEMAARGATAREIMLALRRLQRSFYTLLAVQSLSYLHRVGLLDAAQALVGEMLGIFPVFFLEEGRLVPLSKARSTRHLVDVCQEFVEEFGQVLRLGVMYGTMQRREALLLRERLSNVFPEHDPLVIEAPLAVQALFGPRLLVLFLQELPEE